MSRTRNLVIAATVLAVACQSSGDEIDRGIPDEDIGIEEPIDAAEPDEGFDAATPDSRDTSDSGIETGCPHPVIGIEEGEEVVPLSLIHLHGEQSQAATGTIESYTWTVDQPSENPFGMLPDNHAASPTHEIAVSGEYQYCLDACDAHRCSDDPACGTTACKRVVACACGAGIHCELTWKTPGDADSFDHGPDSGSDIDLHLLHPFATGPDLDGDGRPDGWFDMRYDVFFGNRNPEWESANPNLPDDPALDRDDTDGAGPENVNLDALVAGRVYRVGVHNWDDHGFGFSYPRLKCYVWGSLVFDSDLEALGTKMYPCDLWEAVEIHWPQGIVMAVLDPDGSRKITHDYGNPSFPCGAEK